MLYAQQTTFHYQDVYEWEGADIPSAVRVRGRITLDMIQDALSDTETGLPTIGIPVMYMRDQIQSGGMFNKQVTDCLVVKNAEHPDDYFHFVFTVRTTGTVTTIGIYHSGQSPNSGKAALKEQRQKSSSLFDNFMGAVTRTNDQGMAEEYDYYGLVFDVIRKTFGI